MRYLLHRLLEPMWKRAAHCKERLGIFTGPPWFFTPICTLSNPDLTNRDLIKKNSSYCADTICIIEKNVKKQKSE